MPKTIQIRNVPDKVHRTLKKRAEAERIPLSAYLLRELERMAEWPTNAEIVERLKGLKPAELTEDPLDIIREARGR